MDNIYVLLYPARGFAGRLIRWQTRSKYSHAAIVVGAQLWEALQGNGVLTRLVFAALKRYGVQLFARTEPWEVSPGMLVRSVKLVEEERKDELFGKLAISTDADRE